MNDQMKMRSQRKSHLLPSVALLQLLLTALLVYAAGGGVFNLKVTDDSTHQTLPIFATTNITASGATNITNYLCINSSMTNVLDFQIDPSTPIDSAKWDFGNAIGVAIRSNPPLKCVAIRFFSHLNSQELLLLYILENANT